MPCKSCKIAFFLILAFFLLKKGQSTKRDNNFIINGDAKGFADSTLVILEFDAGGADTTIMLNEKFTFTGVLKKNAEHVLVRSSGYSDYKYFWLENTTIQIKLENSEFKSAKIYGSKTQRQAEILDSLIGPLKTIRESLSSQLMINDSTVDRANLKQQYLRNEQNLTKAYSSYIKMYHQTTLSLHLLNTFSVSWGKEKTQYLFNLFPEYLKNSEEGVDIKAFLSMNKNVSVGHPFVDLRQYNANDSIIHLSSFKGKVILLEFWAAWCAPCRRQNVELVELNRKFLGKKFTIVSVSMDKDKGEWLEAVKLDKLDWLNVHEFNFGTNSGSLIYGVYELPSNYVIDKQGIIIGINLSGEALEKKIAVALTQ